MCLQKSLFVFITCKVCAASELARGCLEKKHSKGTQDFVNSPPPPLSTLVLLISRLQSYCNQCSLLAPCGINVTEINFTIFFFFFIRPPATVISFPQSKFMCPRIQFPSHPHKLEVQRLIGIHLVITVIHPSMNNAILNLKCLIIAI